MKKNLLAAGFGLFAITCCQRPEKLRTNSVDTGTARLVIQKLPDDYGGNSGDTSYTIDYFRMIITCNEKFKDSASVNYVNFGIEHSLALIRGKDTVAPDFFQRIANGKSKTFEYVAAFNKQRSSDKNFSFYLKDEVFGLGKVILNF